MKLAAILALLSPLLVSPDHRGLDTQDPDLEVKTPHGYIRLWNFQNIEVAEDGQIKGTATGDKVKLEDTERGITLAGKTMSVTLRRVEGGFAVGGAIADGGAEVTSDSKVAFEALKDTSATPPQAPEGFQTSKLTTEKVTYSVDAGKGTLVIPQALTIVNQGEGTRLSATKQRLPFSQKATIHGKSAHLTVELDPQGLFSRPLSGRVEGRVDFTLDRSEQVLKDGNLVPDSTHLEGQTDLLEANLAGVPEPNLTASGNVVFSGTGRGFAGKVTGARAVIVLDETMKPIRYQFVGNPASTRVGFGSGK